MEIKRLHSIDPVADAERKQSSQLTVHPKENQGNAVSSDTVSLSKAARELADLAKASSSSRKEKAELQAIKDAIASGKYRVDYKALARKIIEESGF